MNVPKSIFRQYDIRGIVGDELTPEFARALGRAFASVALGAARPRADARRRPRQPAVGRRRSPRASGTGIADAGGTAVDVGVLPTPALYFAVQHLGDRRRRPGHGLAQSARVQRLQDGARRRVGARRRHPGALGERSSPSAGAAAAGRETRRRLGARALPRRDRRRGTSSRGRCSVVVDCGNGAGSLIAVATLRSARRRGRRRSSASRTAPSRTTIPTRPSPRTSRDLQAAVRRARRRARHRLRRRRRPHRRGGRERARSSSATSCSCSSGATRCGASAPGTPVIFDVKCSEVLPRGAARGRAPGR